MADIRQFLDGRSRTYDADLLLGAAGYNYATAIPGKDAKNASATAGTDGYVDLGDGYTQGFAVFDLHTIAAGSTPAISAGGNLRIWLEGAKDTSFTTTVPLAVLELGDVATSTAGRINMIGGDDVTDQTRYFVPFHNRFGDEMYRYVRMWVNVGNTLDTVGLSGFLTGLH